MKLIQLCYKYLITNFSLAEKIYMNISSFLFYYLKLRITVLFGFHKTANPLGLRWRWGHWKNTQIWWVMLFLYYSFCHISGKWFLHIINSGITDSINNLSTQPIKDLQELYTYLKRKKPQASNLRFFSFTIYYFVKWKTASPTYKDLMTTWTSRTCQGSTLWWLHFSLCGGRYFCQMRWCDADVPLFLN